MVRLFVIIALSVCFLSAGKVALLRFKGKPKPVAKASVWEADGRLRAFPTAMLSTARDFVYSPYRENTLLSVRGARPGELMRCGASKRPFYVPLRHDLDYGSVVGDWRIQRLERDGVTEYEVRFLAELGWFTGHGHRVKRGGRALPPDKRSQIDLTGHFEDGRFVCHYDETFPGSKVEQGSFDWEFSSAQGLLQGVASVPTGLIDSQGKRLAGSQGVIPKSGKEAKAFLPKGWKMLDHLSGLANKRGDGFLAMVFEEPGVEPRRWLVLAHRRKNAGLLYHALISTPHACRRHLGNGEGDPFQGLTLPYETKRNGIFGLRHHASRDYEHAGLDLWFQFDDQAHEWRLSEGRRYKFDLTEATPKVDWVSVVPGTSLASFRIHAVAFENGNPSPPSTTVDRQITAVGS